MELYEAIKVMVDADKCTKCANCACCVDGDCHSSEMVGNAKFVLTGWLEENNPNPVSKITFDEAVELLHEYATCSSRRCDTCKMYKYVEDSKYVCPNIVDMVKEALREMVMKEEF